MDKKKIKINDKIYEVYKILGLICLGYAFILAILSMFINISVIIYIAIMTVISLLFMIYSKSIENNVLIYESKSINYGSPIPEELKKELNIRYKPIPDSDLNIIYNLTSRLLIKFDNKFYYEKIGFSRYYIFWDNKYIERVDIRHGLYKIMIIQAISILHRNKIITQPTTKFLMDYWFILSHFIKPEQISKDDLKKIRKQDIVRKKRKVKRNE